MVPQEEDRSKKGFPIWLLGVYGNNIFCLTPIILERRESEILGITCPANLLTYANHLSNSWTLMNLLEYTAHLLSKKIP